ncbi:vinorine synthase-like [Tripterygium wilfordii]|uniref:vinorine synthase-like n=1 Tax=Tripterygium wilfordii TaxID=458696 RepID=UPI0018F815BC|nr:vinorine synthase-like [Tripterygium wilfordii]
MFNKYYYVERVVLTMKVEIVSRETIKPSSPTPQQLKIFKLSLLDQLAPSNYSRAIYFYPANANVSPHHHASGVQAKTLQLLKASLTNILTLYYPFAGRFKDRSSIECSDEGVDFVEARINCVLSHLLQNHDAEQPEELLPVEAESMGATTGSLLQVQANFFVCGSIAISICLSHKVADAVSFFTFVKSWFSTARESSFPAMHNPEFFFRSDFLPPQNSLLPPLDFSRGKCVRKRFVFNSTSIAKLKAKTASASVQQPTRAEAVTALLWKCAMTTSRLVQGFSSKSLCFRRINLRSRFTPPLSEFTFGNLVGLLVTPKKMMDEEMEIDLTSSVCQLRKGRQEFKVDDLEGQDLLLGESETNKKEIGNLIRKENVHFFFCSSVCGMEVYEADFGWGKPIWMCLSNIKKPNVAYLVDTRDGDGIEALVCLSEEEMAVFERNEELLASATLSPNILDVNICAGNKNSRL